MRSAASYSTWFNGGIRTTSYFHNQIGILTEQNVQRSLASLGADDLLIGWSPRPALLLTAHIDTVTPTWQREASLEGDVVRHRAVEPGTRDEDAGTIAILTGDFLFARAADLEVGEAQVDRDAARLLLGQAVGVDAGQRAHQRRLAVVDVARGADDHASSPAAIRAPTRVPRRNALPCR